MPQKSKTEIIAKITSIIPFLENIKSSIETKKIKISGNEEDFFESLDDSNSLLKSIKEKLENKSNNTFDEVDILQINTEFKLLNTKLNKVLNPNVPTTNPSAAPAPVVPVPAPAPAQPAPAKAPQAPPAPPATQATQAAPAPQAPAAATAAPVAPVAPAAATANDICSELENTPTSEAAPSTASAQAGGSYKKKTTRKFKPLKKNSKKSNKKKSKSKH
jgi:hypothetical protein